MSISHKEPEEVLCILTLPSTANVEMVEPQNGSNMGYLNLHGKKNHPGKTAEDIRLYRGNK